MKLNVTDRMTSSEARSMAFWTTYGKLYLATDGATREKAHSTTYWALYWATVKVTRDAAVGFMKGQS